MPLVLLLGLAALLSAGCYQSVNGEELLPVVTDGATAIPTATPVYVIPEVIVLSVEIPTPGAATSEPTPVSATPSPTPTVAPDATATPEPTTSTLPEGSQFSASELLGKMIRIDVSEASAAEPYMAPSDNPFVNVGGARPEIWALGLRNPWRMAFDAGTGSLWVGDVGQNAVEEISVVSRGGNYGWDIVEGNICHEPSSGCSSDGLTAPWATYKHTNGRCSVTGGVVWGGGGAGSDGRVRLRRLLQRRAVGDANGWVGGADRGSKRPREHRELRRRCGG